MAVKEADWRPLAAVAGAALLVVLDGTVVAVALNSLATSFQVRLDQVVWATTAYLLAVAAVLPVLGRLTARLGARRVFVIGLLVFLAGSGLTALSWSVPALVLFRVVQGLGGGLVEPTAMTLAAGLAPAGRMGRVMGVMSTVVNVAPVLGPLVGGLLLETGHWQWIFVINLPLGLVVLVAVLAATRADPIMPDPARAEPSDAPRPDLPRPDASRADVPGLVMLTAGFVAVLLALNRSGEGGADPAVVLIGLSGAALLVLYVPYALRLHRAPALDLRLFARPGFGPGLGVMGLVGLVMYSQMASLPLFAAERFGLAGLRQGVLVSALGIGLLVSMSVGGRLSDGVGARPLVLSGSVVTLAGALVFAAAHASLPPAALYALFVVIGLGFGATAAPTVAGVFRLLGPGEQAAGSTALFMTVQFGASLGVTLLGLLQTVTDDWVRWLFLVVALAQAAVFALGTRLSADVSHEPDQVLSTSGQPPHLSSS
ncbi:MFS transporter [Kineosporia sp. J2-2]|uniref:MFS transporter n=1 Tax=Kineosporia corallincola TaxID=2835133 RepID=A0ABS5TJQ8_9ACTN|nr:MFS transporter [Kineosporia corallincola]MBT0771330.1 MFS transporter [Kineosporia corallincola]